MKDDISSVIIESMSDGLLVLNPRGYIIHINRAGLGLLDLGLEETSKKTYAQLFVDEPENDAFNDILFNGIQSQETRLYREVPFRRRDGGRLDLAVTTSFLRTESENGGNAGIVVVFKDITEFKALDRARHRVLDHLSHELRTPLSIISASLKRLETSSNERSLVRVNRNLKRLQDIQLEVEDIVKQRDLTASYGFKPWLEQTLDLLDVLAEEDPVHVKAVQVVKDRVEGFFHVRDSDVQDLRIGEYIPRVVSLARQLSTHRSVALLTELEEDPYIRFNGDVLEKVLMGLIKNAIENTPDGGEVLVSLRISPQNIEVEIKDTGTGITAESRKQIFGGFYHAKETDLYSTKKPFDFGAGGKGLDLLRLKIFADVHQFRVNCESARCQYIPRENDSCPGVVSECPYIQRKEQCAQSGGTAFKLEFS